MLETILFFLISIIVFGFQPFTSSLLMPSAVRGGVLLILAICFIAFSIKKKKTFYFTIIYVPIAIILFFFWQRSSPGSVSVIVYSLALVTFFIGLLLTISRIPLLKPIISNFLFVLVLATALLAIISFISFNFNLIPYESLELGDFSYYNFYYNPFLGYVSPKKFGDGTIGRVSVFMFEPSYLSWFLTTNFFLLSRYIKRNKWGLLIAKLIVFTGAMCTFSTAAWVVFGILFLIGIAKWVLKKLTFKDHTIKKVVRISLATAVLIFIFMPKEIINDSLGASSFSDREGRVEYSLILLATSSVTDLTIGRAPGYIENNSDKGESNQWIKLLVEEGIVGTLFAAGFIIYCTKNNDNYMLATLLFLNSVVVFWTPLFVLNILVCKWEDDRILNNSDSDFPLA